MFSFLAAGGKLFALEWSAMDSLLICDRLPNY
jgi:hypothetical protein